MKRRYLFCSGQHHALLLKMEKQSKVWHTVGVSSRRRGGQWMWTEGFFGHGVRVYAIRCGCLRNLVAHLGRP